MVGSLVCAQKRRGVSWRARGGRKKEGWKYIVRKRGKRETRVKIIKPLPGIQRVRYDGKVGQMMHVKTGTGKRELWFKLAT